MSAGRLTALAAALVVAIAGAGTAQGRSPDLARALDRGLELTPAGGELVVLPTYTAMLALRRVAGERGLVRPYWEETAA